MPSLRLLFLADPQLGCYATFSGLSEADIREFAARGMVVRPQPPAVGWEWDAARYEDAVRAATALEPDLVVIGGDMVNDVADAGQVEAFRRITAGFPDDLPVHVIPGNHDITADFRTPTPESTARYHEVFGPEELTFHLHDTTFVAMNTVLLDRPEHMAAECRDHLAALDDALGEAATRPGPTILVGHQPLFLERPDEPDSYWNVSPPNRAALLDLVARHRPDLVLSGHLHRNATVRHEGVEMVTTSAVGYPLGRDPSGFRVVDVGPDGVTHRFVGLTDQGWVSP